MSETNYIFKVSEKDLNGNKFYEKGDNKENPDNFYYGRTYMPGKGNDVSPDNNVYIFTASFLSDKKQAMNTAHEGYGHALFYELSKSNNSYNPYHTKGKIIIKGFDLQEMKMETYPIFINNNIKLELQIRSVEQQTIKNYESLHD